jgi:hypothetical protein
MTIDRDRPAFGWANVTPAAEASIARKPGERIGDKAVGASDTATNSIASEEDRVERARLLSIRPMGDVEDTDPERRVLAHERILQVLIAHLAETEPKFITRLNAVFTETAHVGRREHDHTDTHAYADQFVREVRRLIERRTELDAAHGLSPKHLSASAESRNAAAVTSDDRAITLIEVSLRAGIWAVTTDGRFHGHYIRDQAAFDAAEAVAFAVVAGGGAADILWTDARAEPGGDSDQTAAARIGVVRTMEFRAGSAPIPRQH